MKTRIQYPLEGNSEVLDGRLHDVSINQLIEIDVNGEKYYLAHYTDITASNKKMITFLKEINGVLCKVPLKEYDMSKIITCLKGCPQRSLTRKQIEKIIPEVIGLAETTTIEDIANNANIRSRNVTIQYPYVPTSDGIDGNIHQVVPLNIVRCSVNSFDLYYMEYYDISLSQRMITFMIRIDGALYKVPLTAYNVKEIEEFVRTYGVSLVDPVSLFAGAGIPTDRPTVGLAMTMSLDELCTIDMKDNQTVIEYPYYIPYNPENPMNISDRVFRSSCRIYQGDDVDFVFDKERNGNLIENAIREAIRNNLDKIERGESFFIDIEVSIPSGETANIPTKDGRMVKAVYIPGVHKRRIFMTPCDKKEMDRPTRLCERLSIKTNKTYAEYDEEHEAFEGGYKGVLPVTFLGLPNDYKDRKTFYATESRQNPVVKDVDYFSSETVLDLKDLYFMAMDGIRGLAGGLLTGLDYQETYESNIADSIILSLIEDGYTKPEAVVILQKIRQEYANKKNVPKRGF